MKLSTFHQSYWNRRSNSFRSSSQLDPSDGFAVKSPAAVFWLIIRGLCCLISLLLGFRFSGLVVFFLFSTSGTTNLDTTPFRASELDVHSSAKRNLESAATVISRTASYSRVVVGRHGIRIRPWPHPDPVEVVRAHKLVERVHREQKVFSSVKNPRTVLAVTPTYVRTFQALHLTGVMHSLMLVPYDLVWIVVEAGGASDETASIINKSGLKTMHVGFDQPMPNTWEDRHKLEAKMRLHALRVAREEKLDGIVVFADESNIHSMELFDEIQKLKWFGAVSIGILGHSGNADELSSLIDKRKEEESPLMPIQGPACNASNKLIGWHTFDTLPYAGKSAVYVNDRATLLPGKLEWSGFVLNSRLLWQDVEDKPEWFKDDLLGENKDIESPLTLVKDPFMLESLGSCGRQVLIWWLRVEARADSNFPLGWILDPPLEISMPLKRTTWPNSPPELPASVKAATATQESTVKHASKQRRSKHQSKKKHEAQTIDTSFHKAF